MPRIIALEADDIRFPTSRGLIGSDAMNHDPDYSAVYVTLRTDDASGLAGHALIFTIGRGNEVQTTAVRTLSELVVGREVDAMVDDLGAFARPDRRFAPALAGPRKRRDAHGHRRGG